ncbi:MAG TPA: 50S ribosomal protein L21 [Flavihumibacter sp.]|nr:50S ribosomal protein L21 [Bacteroidota bacterium]HOA37878.1 50S ribosomal protein L21 [Flavihumibacter sp.]HQD08944.1 50S ribosomal protein L21 [Flavihumibacter sp.]
MFAVVKIAGQQFKVEKDQTLYVPQISGKAGDKVEFSEVLLVDNNGSLNVGSAVKAIVKAEIVDHLQGDKVIAFKMKRRKGFRKKIGHRNHYTKIKINEIA